MNASGSRVRPLTLAVLAAVAALVGALVVVVVRRDGGSTEPGSTTATTSGPAVTTTVPTELFGEVRTVVPAVETLVLGPDGLLSAGDQIVVVTADPSDEAAAEAAAAAVGGSVIGRVEFVGLWQIGLPATDTQGLAAAIAAAGAVPGVDLAFPNNAIPTDEEVWGTPVSPLDDPAYSGPAGDGYRMIGVDRAWTYLRGSGLPLGPVRVGVLDTGMWAENGEFGTSDGVTVDFPTAGNGARANPDATGGHGTRVANMIGADPNNGGVAGVAGVLGPKLTVSVTNNESPPYGNTPTAGQWGVDPIMTGADPNDPSKVTVPSGATYTCGAMQAIIDQLSTDPPARIINMSWGRTGTSPQAALAWRMFFERMAADHPDTLFVASAGNNSQVVDGSRRFPSGLPLDNMITVGNVMNDGTKAASSNEASANFEVTLAAPGEQALKAIDDQGNIVNTNGGTSMAAPQVTAAAALLLSLDPTLTPAEIKDLLVRTAATEVDLNGQKVAVSAGVGGRVLRVDEAVREVIREQRAALGLEPADLTPEYLADLGRVDAVAVSGEANEWTVRGIVKACDPPCTDLAIDVSEGMAVGGDTVQGLAGPGEVVWSVTVAEYPATIVVRRLDNGAASVIRLDPIDLNGHWSGAATIGAVTLPEGVSPEDLEGCDVGSLVGMQLGMEMDVTADVGGGGVVVLTLTPPADTEGNPTTNTVPLTWDGNRVEIGMATEEGAFQFVGTAARQVDESVVITGTWTSANAEAGVSVTGTWTVTKVG